MKQRGEVPWRSSTQSNTPLCHKCACQCTSLGCVKILQICHQMLQNHSCTLFQTCAQGSAGRAGYQMLAQNTLHDIALGMGACLILVAERGLSVHHSIAPDTRCQKLAKTRNKLLCQHSLPHDRTGLLSISVHDGFIRTHQIVGATPVLNQVVQQLLGRIKNFIVNELLDFAERG